MKWKVAKYGKDTNIILADGSGATICTVNDGWPKAEVDQHARLIAKAPKMVEALKLARGVLIAGGPKARAEIAQHIFNVLAEVEGK